MTRNKKSGSNNIPLLMAKQKVFNPFRARKFLQRFYHLALMVLGEFKSSVKLGARHSLKAWLNGYCRFNYRLYSLDSHDEIKQFISDVQMVKQLNINNRFTDSIINKLNFALLMKNYGMSTSEPLGLLRNGVFYPIDSPNPLTPAKFLDLFADKKEPLVIKPNWGVHGRGFLKIAPSKEGFWVNGQSVATSQLLDLLKGLDNYLVSNFIRQGAYAAQLNPHTTNTLRIITLWDLDEGKPFIARAVQRIGTSRSYPVDNFKAGLGGLSAAVDLDSGELSAAASATPQGKVIWHQRHPEHQAEIQGRKIPNWPEICQSLVDYAATLFYMPSIAWDLVPTDTGFTVIEGNPYSGMAVIQVHGPLLNDPRIRKMYRHYGVIS